MELSVFSSKPTVLVPRAPARIRRRIRPAFGGQTVRNGRANVRHTTCPGREEEARIDEETDQALRTRGGQRHNMGVHLRGSWHGNQASLHTAHPPCSPDTWPPFVSAALHGRRNSSKRSSAKSSLCSPRDRRMPRWGGCCDTRAEPGMRIKSTGGQWMNQWMNQVLSSSSRSSRSRRDLSRLARGTGQAGSVGRSPQVQLR